MPSILERYNLISRYPGGKFLFGKLVGWNAPFFSKIHPRFIELKPAYCETQIADRRSIHNHLGTIN